VALQTADVPLSPAAERALVLAASAGERRAREHFVEAFLPSIAGVARLYRHSPRVDRAELMQEGVVGLLSALERFDPERGTPFWAYATWWVRQAMQGLVAQTGGAMVLSDRALRQLARVKAARSAHLVSHHSEASVRDLATSTGFAPDHVQSLVAAERPPRGLDEPLKRSADAMDSVGDMLADPQAQDGFDDVVQHVASEEVRNLPGDLSKRERAIVKARYGIGQPASTLRDVADWLGVSPERVRQIEKGALAKLRAATVPDSQGPAAPHTNGLLTVRGDAGVAARTRRASAGGRALRRPPHAEPR